MGEGAWWDLRGTRQKIWHLRGAAQKENQRKKKGEGGGGERNLKIKSGKIAGGTYLILEGVFHPLKININNSF